MLKNLPSSHRHFFSLLALLVLVMGSALRIFDLTDQPIDFHSTRQLRGAIIARGMYYEMLPGADETLREQAISFWRSTGQYEPSILERLVAISYLLVGGEYFWIGRIINTFFWSVAGIALYALARRMASATIHSGFQSEEQSPWVVSLSAFLALTFFIFLPFSVQASRSFQPDPGMVMWLLLFAFSIYRWSESQSWKWALLSGLFGGLTILTKAIAFYTVFGIGISMVLFETGFKRQGIISALRNPRLWTMAGLVIVPYGIYSVFLGSARAAEFFRSWTLSLSHLLLEPWFYLRWLFSVQNLFTPVAVILGIIGVFLSRSRNRFFLLGAWVGYIGYGLFLPYQMYSHNYYHLQLAGLISLSMVPFFSWVIQKAGSWRPAWRFLMAGGVVLVLAYFAWAYLIPMRSQDYRGEPAYWQEIASYLPTDGKIIALTQDYGYRLMYYGWRKVSLWPNRGEQNLNSLRGSEKHFDQFFTRQTANKSYFLITSFRQFEDQPELKKHLYAHFPIVAQGNGYLIFSLTSQ